MNNDNNKWWKRIYLSCLSYFSESVMCDIDKNTNNYKKDDGRKDAVCKKCRWRTSKREEYKKTLWKKFTQANHSLPFKIGPRTTRSTLTFQILTVIKELKKQQSYLKLEKSVIIWVDYKIIINILIDYISINNNKYIQYLHLHFLVKFNVVNTFVIQQLFPYPVLSKQVWSF